MMRSFRAFTATLLLITPLLASCDTIADPSSAPPSVERQAGLLGGLIDTTVNLLGAVVGILVGGEDANAPEVTKWIGKDGGTLETGAYTLIVPKGAVSNSTLFGIAPANDGRYATELSATRDGGRIDVGANGFNKPVTLIFSYEGADNLKDPLKLMVVYVAVDGNLVPQPTIIDTNKKIVSSKLDHFSKYALVQN